MKLDLKEHMKWIRTGVLGIDSKESWAFASALCISVHLVQVHLEYWNFILFCSRICFFFNPVNVIIESQEGSFSYMKFCSVHGRGSIPTFVSFFHLPHTTWERWCLEGQKDADLKIESWFHCFCLFVWFFFKLKLYKACELNNKFLNVKI